MFPNTLTHRPTVGIAERTERLLIGLVATGLSGLGVPYVLSIGLWSLAAVSVFTFFQRVLAARRSAAEIAVAESAPTGPAAPAGPTKTAGPTETSGPGATSGPAGTSDPGEGAVVAEAEAVEQASGGPARDRQESAPEG